MADGSISVEQEFDKHNSLKTFVEQALRNHKGNRKSATASLEHLLECSQSARHWLASDFVETVYQSMKSAEDEKRAYEVEERRRIASMKRYQQYKIVDDALGRLEGEAHALSDLDIHAYFGNVKGPANVLIEKHFTKEVLKLARPYDRKKIGKIFEDIRRSREIDNRLKECMAELHTNADKAASFDRIVMALDAVKVGGKLLGDCTGGDLLREAAKLEAIANEMTAQAVFYRQLAEIVGKTTTVREASNRVGIVGLLSTHYNEP